MGAFLTTTGRPHAWEYSGSCDGRRLFNRVSVSMLLTADIPTDVHGTGYAISGSSEITLNAVSYGSIGGTNVFNLSTDCCRYALGFPSGSVNTPTTTGSWEQTSTSGSPIIETMNVGAGWSIDQDPVTLLWTIGVSGGFVAGAGLAYASYGHGGGSVSGIRTGDLIGAHVLTSQDGGNTPYPTAFTFTFTVTISRV